MPAPAEVQNQQDQLGLVDIPPLPDTTYPLPDATTNILVDLPGVSDNEPPMDVMITVPTIDNEGEPTDTTLPTKVSTSDAEPIRPSQLLLPVHNIATAVPCSIILKDVSVKL